MAKLNGGIVITGLVVTGLLGGMAWFNPSLEDYEAYASQTLNRYLTTTVCERLTPMEVLLNQSCEQILGANQEAFEALIHSHTQRYNLGLFSLYQTRLGLPIAGILPAYQVNTIGVLGRFYILRVTQVK
ncbi:MAG: DUF4359 domain-containing protein [Leptolyngbyaceae cyanobacterium SM2_3_12]|nr:DUF4359 domain-containing protein [Leptolyngbyaceae cyanobacterium SM2_3_12]